jgi:hypothetical protein
MAILVSEAYTHIHEKHNFKYLKNPTVTVCKIWCNDGYMYILYCDNFWWKLIDKKLLNSYNCQSGCPNYCNCLFYFQVGWGGGGLTLLDEFITKIQTFTHKFYIFFSLQVKCQILTCINSLKKTYIPIWLFSLRKINITGNREKNMKIKPNSVRIRFLSC